MNESSTTISKLLNGINNTLNIANKAVPLYKEAKPMFKTITNTYKTIKNNKNDLTNLIKLNKLKNTIKQDMNTNITNNDIKKISITQNNTYSNINNPTFFI